MNDNVEESKTDEDIKTETANELSFDDKITIELTDNFPTKTVGSNERNDLGNKNMLNTFNRLEVSVIYDNLEKQDNSIVINIQIRGLDFEAKIDSGLGKISYIFKCS